MFSNWEMAKNEALPMKGLSYALKSNKIKLG